MIFAVAGSQLAFPRLMNALHELAPRYDQPIFAQTADPEFESDRIEHAPFLDPREFEDRLKRASVIVAHAGIGILIAAATHSKPLIVMPRQSALNEHRNDHQMATASRFDDREGFTVVHDGDALATALANPGEAMGMPGNPASDALIGAIRREIA